MDRQLIVDASTAGNAPWTPCNDTHRCRIDELVILCTRQTVQMIRQVTLLTCYAAIVSATDRGCAMPTDTRLHDLQHKQMSFGRTIRVANENIIFIFLHTFAYKL
jgi:hypothetical protein